MATEEKLKEDELKEIIRKKRGGNGIEYHGPYKIGTADVWEIWTWTNQNKRTRMIGLLKHDSYWKMKTVRNFTSPILQT